MKRKIELLAPGGDIESIKAAIAAGADAVYLGLNVFNARYRATNIEFDDLSAIVSLAHRNSCQIFITINIVIIESEFRALITLLNRLANAKIDGVIVQDLGLFYLLSKQFKTLKIHASTQLTTHNAGQIKFLRRLSATRVNLSRELNLTEIKTLSAVGHEHNISTEVFVHGSNCLSFSGLCYISSVHDGKSGNRGRCSQPCRDQYLTTAEDKDFPLNLKDNSAFNDLQELHDAGVDALKIEGRIKKFHYVYTVVHSWRKLLDNFYQQNQSRSDDTALYRVFNRDFSNGFLQDNIGGEMFIDNPRDNSARYFSEIKGCTDTEGVQQTKQELYDLRTGIMADVRAKVAVLDDVKSLLTITVSGENGSPLEISVTTADGSIAPFTVRSETALVPIRSGAGHDGDLKNGPGRLDYERLDQQLAAINDSEHTIERLDLEPLEKGLFLPFKELSAIKKKLLYILNGAKEPIAPIETPRLKKPLRSEIKPTLAVLISDQEHLDLCHKSAADFFFQLPNCFPDDGSELIDLFSKNSALTPWFPAVLIGEDYSTAVDILQKVAPKQIVTDNTGIAFEAYKRGIDWIAGPSLNSVNSFTLLCLKQQFNCVGAFISNELSKNQMKKIVTPEDFQLCYSIYHPIVLMTCRHCLQHQIDGCDKGRVDRECTLQCNRSASITSMKKVPLLINKTQGFYHRIFNNHNFLNTEIVTDLPDRFSSFLIDLTAVKTETDVAMDRIGLIHSFEKLLGGDPTAKQEIENTLQPSTNIQYKKGI